MEEHFPSQVGDFGGSTSILKGIKMYKTYFQGSWEIISLKAWLEKKSSCKPAAGRLRKKGIFKQLSESLLGRSLAQYLEFSLPNPLLTSHPGRVRVKSPLMFPKWVPFHGGRTGGTFNGATTLIQMGRNIKSPQNEYMCQGLNSLYWGWSSHL